MINARLVSLTLFLANFKTKSFFKSEKRFEIYHLAQIFRRKQNELLFKHKVSSE